MKKLLIVIVLVFIPAVSFAQCDFDTSRLDIPSQTILNCLYSPTTGGVSVDVQDQTTPPIDFYMGKITNTTTISVQSAINDKTITVADTTGFSDGAYVLIRLAEPAGNFIFYLGFEIGAPSGNIITLDSPINYAFPVGSIVAVGTADMDVDGSLTSQIFNVFGPRSGAYDITRVMIKMLCPAGPTLDAFCSLTALTNGVVLRSYIDGEYRNIYNVKKNSDWALLTYDYNPFTAVGQGQDGVLFRNTFAGQDKHGVAIRLSSEDDQLQIVIQDDLTALVEFRIIIQGHFTQDN